MHLDALAVRYEQLPSSVLLFVGGGMLDFQVPPQTEWELLQRYAMQHPPPPKRASVASCHLPTAPALDSLPHPLPAIPCAATTHTAPAPHSPL